MELTEAVVLGIIQGLSEWLPISSEGMVTLAGRFLFDSQYQDALGSAIWLHTGTTISALVYFRNDILEILKMANRHLFLFLLISTLSTAITAVPLLILALNLEIPESLFTIMIGIFLLGIAWLHKTRKISGQQKQLTDKNAFVAGIIQGFAILPGLSRSGLTIATLLGQKYPLHQSFRLSFLMSIPVTSAVQIVYPLAKGEFSVSAELLAGTIAAAVVGLLTIKYLMELSEKINFSTATFALGALVIVLGFII
ncbi:undecaprenyl-diphosphate phosphatase [Candidatus Micrarchaeota archaeon]|nr:undecaprenyl-diphosphate phosphatase [Candidatus Micrarchaeota archaeon]